MVEKSEATGKLKIKCKSISMGKSHHGEIFNSWPKGQMTEKAKKD
jgi:hypothetical protein